VNAGIISQINP